MAAGEVRAAFRSWMWAWLGLVTCLPAGCALCRSSIDHAIPADQGLAERSQNLAEAYTVNCPDVLDVTIEGHPQLSGPREIRPDGRIDLGNIGRVRVEGNTVLEVARLLARIHGLSSNAVRVRVVEYRSQQLYLIGQVAGLQRVVPYQGPETVVDLLHRVGGLTPGAAPDSVRVVRSRIAAGERPEVIRVDLQAILLKHDVRTNVYVRPQDQIYVGETRQLAVSKCIPPWLRPMYETLWGMRRPTANAGAVAAS